MLKMTRRTIAARQALSLAPTRPPGGPLRGAAPPPPFPAFVPPRAAQGSTPCSEHHAVTGFTARPTAATAAIISLTCAAATRAAGASS